MRRLITGVLIVALLMPFTASAGDPLDANDGPVSYTNGAAVDYYCDESGFDGVMTVSEVWACSIALQQEQGGWWDWPW